IDNIPPSTGSPVNDAHLAESDTTFTTFEFSIKHVFAKTFVQILNVNPAIGTSANSDIYLAGDIENPIGHTYVKNVRGGIFSDDAMELHGIESTGVNSSLVAIFAIPGADVDVETIRTNFLELDADVGAIGRQTGPRVPIAAEVVRFRDETGVSGALFDFIVRAEAFGDLVLDVTANERGLTSHAASIAVQIDYLRAGNDVDVVVHDSIQGTDLGTGFDVLVNLYDPPDADTELTGTDMSGTYVGHFRPDVIPAGLERILRAFGTADRTLVNSTYTFGDLGTTFGDLRAGDDIDVRHDETGTVLSFVTFTDVAAVMNDLDNGQPMIPVTELDDCCGVDVPQIFLRTNGSIVERELSGDLLAGHINSTASDVTLLAPIRILDADRAPTIDVTGVNITMTAGIDGGAEIGR